MGSVALGIVGAGIGSQLADLKVTGASYGRPGGTIIWTSGWRTTQIPAMGGDSSRAAGVAYSSSFAVAIAAGEIASLLKIWADGTILYDAEAAGAVIAPELRFRFYSGSENQL